MPEIDYCILKKDLPFVKAGEKLNKVGNSEFWKVSGTSYTYKLTDIKNCPEFFDIVYKKQPNQFISKKIEHAKQWGAAGPVHTLGYLTLELGYNNPESDIVNDFPVSVMLYNISNMPRHVLAFKYELTDEQLEKIKEIINEDL